MSDYIYKCYLCVTMDWDKERNIPVFIGYRIYSTEPWNLSNTGQINSALYVTMSTKNYADAHQIMLETVQRLAELLPGQFWKTVWKWIDPSPEAQDEQYELLMDAQKIRRREGNVLRVLSFTRTPGSRYQADGPSSGEQFREEHLLPALQNAMKNEEVLTVDLDGTEGYAVAFLEEAFGGLVRKLKVEPQEILKSLRIICIDEPELVQEIQDHIRNAKPKS